MPTSTRILKGAGASPSHLNARVLTEQFSALRPFAADRQTIDAEMSADRLAETALSRDEALSLPPETMELEHPAKAGTDHPSILPGSGHSLDSASQSFFALRYGQDFSHVRVHADQQSNTLAQALGARAFTVGRDVVFGPGEYAPSHAVGRRLVAHELAHVLQQSAPGGRPTLQRQAIPPELMSSIDVTLMSTPGLQRRYDQITQTMAMFNESNASTALLNEEAGRIGIEVSKRAAGHVFAADAVERMKQYFVTNAKSPRPDDCITCMNRGLRLLLDDPKQAVRGEVQTTMQQLQLSGRAGPARIVDFIGPSGRVTNGTLRPDAPQQSVWDALLEMSSGEVGWSVFGLGIMDGFHSVTLTLDNTDPSDPKVYWSDQWGSKGGWTLYDRATLDAEITKLTQG